MGRGCQEDDRSPVWLEQGRWEEQWWMMRPEVKTGLLE